MVGSLWMSKVRIGETPALLLGPLTVEPPFRERGIGQLLMQKTMDDARAKGHKLVVLVGDEPYYAKAGFKVVPVKSDASGDCDLDALRAALGPLAEHLEHVGSTAVPGLAAKPIIDLALGFADEAARGEIAARLPAL